MQSERTVNKTPFDGATLFFSIIAIILITIGIYLKNSHKLAVGISQPNRYGYGGGYVQKIPGLFVIGLGIFFACFPLLDVVRYLRKRL